MTAHSLGMPYGSETRRRQTHIQAHGVHALIMLLCATALPCLAQRFICNELDTALPYVALPYSCAALQPSVQPSSPRFRSCVADAAS